MRRALAAAACLATTSCALSGPTVCRSAKGESPLMLRTCLTPRGIFSLQFVASGVGWVVASAMQAGSQPEAKMAVTLQMRLPGGSDGNVFAKKRPAPAPQDAGARAAKSPAHGLPGTLAGHAAARTAERGSG